MGRALEDDEYGRDEELGGASSVAVFKRIHEENGEGIRDREKKAREVLQALGLAGEEHELLAEHRHTAHPAAKKPKSLKEIGDEVKAKMEECREAFMRVEELWFERDIAVACGGWIEMLVRAVEQHPDLNLKREGEDGKKGRTAWDVELVGGVANPRPAWPAEGETSMDYIPADWIPGEGEWESSEGEWGDSTGGEGDVSWNGSEEDEEDEEGGVERRERRGWGENVWLEKDDGKKEVPQWGVVDEEVWNSNAAWGGVPGATKIPSSSSSSTAGWDGDESDDTTSGMNTS